MNTIAISVKNVTVQFQLSEYKVTTLKEYIFRKASGKIKPRTFTAVNNVSFSLNVGESLAIIGHNGSGKSTLLRVLAGIISPNPGASVTVRGRAAPMIELGAGFDPELSGLENIRLTCLLMGLTNEQVDEKLEAIIRFSELEEFIDMPVKNYSSGMYARLGFACTTAVDPEILIVDEVLAVGDSNFAKKCLHRIEQLKSRGASVVMVSHDENVIRTFCSRALVMDRGTLVFDGPIAEAIQKQQEIMDLRAFEALDPAEKANILRQRQLQEEFQLSLSNQSSEKKPKFSVHASLIQDGYEVRKLDLSRSFVFRFDISYRDPEFFKGNPHFGIELRNKNGVRVGGYGSEQESSAPVPRSQLLNRTHLVMDFPFEEGIKNLEASEFRLAFAIHDDEMRRNLFIDTMITFIAENSRLGLNFHDDVISFRNHIKSVVVDPPNL